MHKARHKFNVDYIHYCRLIIVKFMPIISFLFLLVVATTNVASHKEEPIARHRRSKLDEAEKKNLLYTNKPVKKSLEDETNSITSTPRKQNIVNTIHPQFHRIVAENPLYNRDGIPNPKNEVTYDVDKHHLSSPEQVSRTRRLTTNDPSSNAKPLRITFSTEDLDKEAMTAAHRDKIDFIKSKILPRVKDFWSDALSVSPVQGPLKVSDEFLVDGVHCGAYGLPTVPSEHMTRGVDDSDLILYVAGNPSPDFCSGSTLAVAVACSVDQFDRPTAGSINICMDSIALNSSGSVSSDNIQKNINVVIHEVAHVLGFSIALMPYFWDPKLKQPRTERPIQPKNVICSDGSIENRIVPNDNTVKLFTNPVTGKTSAVVVTPLVQTVARNQFNCSDLEGAQLENSPTRNHCLGNHWDEKYFHTEIMSAIFVDSEVVLSPLTLALFEDSGWYFANYKKSEIMPYGHGAGCDFVRKPCLERDFVWDETIVPGYGRGYFCKEGRAGCSSGHHFKMACSLLDYSNVDQEIPPNLQYFANPDYGGQPQNDYCPVFEMPYNGIASSERDCRDGQNFDSNVVPILGEKFGSSSMCFDTNLKYPICYQHECDSAKRKLKLRVMGQEYQCEEDFEQISIVAGFSVICPRLAAACPNLFCPKNCEGRGTCNWSAKGGPKCECFDSSNKSESCSKPSSVWHYDMKTGYWLYNVVLLVSAVSVLLF